MQALRYKVVVGSALCKLCGTKQYLEVLCASFVVQSSTGKCFVQALSYKVVLGSSLCKLCSTKYYWERLCASFVVQSSTGTCFVQVFGSTKYFVKTLLCKWICVLSFLTCRRAEMS